MWYFVGIFVIIQSIALSILVYKRGIRRKKAPESRFNSGTAKLFSDRRRLFVVIQQLRDGGLIDDTSMRRMSAEDKALFEVQLIDALTKWPREDQHQLRSALIKHGYDEQCARRVMCENISDRVRASTLLSLLRPQTQARTGDLIQRGKTESATSEEAKEKNRE
jgi:hypothetical protein